MEYQLDQTACVGMAGAANADGTSQSSVQPHTSVGPPIHMTSGCSSPTPACRTRGGNRRRVSISEGAHPLIEEDRSTAASDCAIAVLRCPQPSMGSHTSISCWNPQREYSCSPVAKNERVPMFSIREASFLCATANPGMERPTWTQRAKTRLTCRAHACHGLPHRSHLASGTPRACNWARQGE